MPGGAIRHTNVKTGKVKTFVLGTHFPVVVDDSVTFVGVGLSHCCQLMQSCLLEWHYLIGVDSVYLGQAVVLAHIHINLVA